MKRIVRLFERVDVLLLALCIVLACLLVVRYGCEFSEAAVSAGKLPPAAQQQGDAATSPSASKPAKEGAPVRFLMYNTQNYFVDADVKRSRYERRIKPVDEREKVAEVIAEAKPEIVGLIEIGGPAALDDLAERLQRRGLNYPHRTVLTRWGEERALAVLSMHPIVEDHSVADAKLVGQTARNMLRGILDVTVEVPGKSPRRFRVVGAHLKSRKDTDAEAARSLRAREARTLAAHLQNALKAHPTQPLLVYGDWNDGPSEPALAVLTQGPDRSRTLSRLQPKDSRGESWTIYYKPADEYNTFDQIYVNDALIQRLRRFKRKHPAEMGIVDKPTGRGYSDHRAVWCDLL